MSQQSVTMSFQDASGSPIANGRLDIRLTYDISDGTAQVSAGRKVSATLNSSGSVTVTLWVNPTGSVYKATAYTALGQPVWNGEFTVS